MRGLDGPDAAAAQKLIGLLPAFVGAYLGALVGEPFDLAGAGVIVGGIVGLGLGIWAIVVLSREPTLDELDEDDD